MPWHVARSGSCPDSKPFAVVRDADGEVEGCHANEQAARRQMAALYAQEALNDMQHKSFDIVETKAADDAGTFEALVAVFDNVDLVNDRIVKGAFSKTLEKWRGTGDPIPVILSHQADDPMAHIGIAHPDDVTETDKGLLVKGRLDISDNDVAKQVHKLMKRRSLKEFSFGYTVPDGGEKRGKDGVNELHEVDLFEVGPTLKGANPATELQAVKSALETEVTPERETKTPDPESSTMGSLVSRMRELAQGDPPTPEAMLAFARRVLNELGGNKETDPLRKRADAVLLEVASGGLSLQRPPKPEPEPEAHHPPSAAQLRRQANELMLELMTGDVPE